MNAVSLTDLSPISTVLYGGRSALRGLDRLFHSQYDFPSGVPFFQIPQRLRGLA